MATVFVEALKVHCIVGLLDSERIAPQLLLVDLSMSGDFAMDALQDQLQASPDYARAAELVNNLLVDGRFGTVEAAADRSCRALLAEFPAVERVEVTLRKPGAIPAAECGGVRWALDRRS